MKTEIWRCLEALEAVSRPDGEACVPFAPLMDHLGWDRPTVRRRVRHLARRGYAEFFRGLVSHDDGTPAGSGYCITRAGRQALESHWRKGRLT